MPLTAVDCVPVLHVSSLERSLEFYLNTLGFEMNFRYQDFYCGLKAGKIYLHLCQGPGVFSRPIGGGNVYLFLEAPAELDDYYAAIVGRGAAPNGPPENWPYEMRDFTVYDPDGNLLTFGAGLEKQTE